ncbi:MAG: HAMP domain-containing histidine kinase [Acetobacteraceae bacterium]|nr:HAMP domain-containing histidine kinase [Acetobacteraceae bacterium]
MSPRRGALPLLGRSAALRLALLFALLFAASVAAFAAVLWWGTAGALDRQTDAAIRADGRSLAARAAEGGVPALVAAIEERMELDFENINIYLLVSREGRVLAGNLPAWPPAMPRESGWRTVPVARDGGEWRTEGRFLHVALPDGNDLLVGRDIAEKLRLRSVLAEGLAFSAAVALTIAVLGAALLRRAVEARLSPAASTAEAIAAGDLTRRVPLSSRGDEFDQLGAIMNTMLDRIGTLMEGVRGVSDSLAHDLRTPLARARGRLEEALATAGEDPAALRGAVERGIADLDQIIRMFHALLRIAEAEAGARRAAFRPLDLAEVAADAAEFYGAAAEARGQRIELSLPDSLPLTGDRDLLLQAIANLLDNAVKFAPPGSSIVLSGGVEGGAAEIRVADAGPGLTAEDRARAGERFFRADSARSTPGSGLGLSLVRAVAHLHGGELLLEDASPGRDPPGLLARLRLGQPAAGLDPEAAARHALA